MKEIVVATDGSALSNPTGAAGWAWFVDEDRWDYGGISRGSNQLAEAMAIYRALASLPKEVPVRIQTDSQFWVNVLGTDGRSGWRAGWKRRGWIKPDGKPPANLKILKAIDALLVKTRKAPTVLEWVKGHGTHRLNNVADKLCTYASFQIREGSTVRGPGWRARSASTLYPYELPASAREVLDAPLDSDGKLVKKRRATKQEIENRKKEAAKKNPTSPVSQPRQSSAAKAQPPRSRTATPKSAPAKYSSPAKPAAKASKTAPSAHSSSQKPRSQSSTGRVSVMSPTVARRKAKQQMNKGYYKAAVLNPPTASQRAKMEAQLKKKAAARKKLAQDPSVISFFDEDNDTPIPVVQGEKRQDNNTYCDACKRPIDPVTKECRCSF